MALGRIASLRRVLSCGDVGLFAIGGGSRDWWVLMRGASLCSSVENVAEIGETGSHVDVKGSRHRWKELPPVPLESAVRALEAIESTQPVPCNAVCLRDNAAAASRNFCFLLSFLLAGYTEGSESTQDRMKRLTALRWVAKCCPNVPHSLINKLFRLRQVGLEVPHFPYQCLIFSSQKF
jgi:hypothetical protein